MKIQGFHPFTSDKTFPGSFRILIPLYITYIIFALSVFFIFIPQQKKQLLDQKKQTILELTNSVLSLLNEYESRIQMGELNLETAKNKAITQIRNLRYGKDGKDYFWINDLHPIMIMHPFRPELEGRDLTLLKDSKGNYPFIAMVETVMNQNSGYVNYYWQWKDLPDKIVPKISYVKSFAPWGWIIGTGLYIDDIDLEIQMIAKKFIRIFGGILVFVLLISVYITHQIVRMRKKKDQAEKLQVLEELRLKKLLELSQMDKESTGAITAFALEEAIALTHSDIGYLAFLDENRSKLIMNTWSGQTMKQCEIEDNIQEYNIDETGLWAHSARSGEPLIINDYETFLSEDKKGFPKGHVPISRFMNIPIFDHDKIVAVAGVGNKEEEYNDSDLRQLQLMMDGMWKILQRKKSEDNLRKSEERYRLLADNATDAIWILALDSLDILYASPSMETLTGFSLSEYTGLKIEERVTRRSLKDIHQTISEELEYMAENGLNQFRKRILEVEMIRKDGTAFWTEVTARFLADNSGKPDRILGISRDISQRKKLEKDLTKSNLDLRLAQQIANVGSWSFDPEAGLFQWSDEVYRLYEQPQASSPLSLDDLKAIYVGKWWKIFESAFQEGLEQGIPYDIELILVLASGKIKWVNIICEPETEKSNSGYFLRGTIQDISDRKNIEHRIQQAQKMEALGTLAGGIAHDFNNILSSMIGFTELAKMDAGDNQDLKQNLEQVLLAGLRARDLVKHILTFSRKADARKSPVNVSSLLKECLKFMKASMPSNIEITRNLQQLQATVLADPTQLHQVFMNLFTNASHAMKEKGGTLNVTLESIAILKDDMLQFKEVKPGNHLQITISDTGTGIPDHLIEKIFEPFFTTKQRGEGTGMGLAMVYGIIKEMEGQISVYSEPDLGTTFRILLPEQADTAENKGFQKDEDLLKGKGRILLVDDESAIIKWSSLVLQKLGYHTGSFTNPQKAFEEFEKNPRGFDLLLTDLSMPQFSGLELSRKIKKKRQDLPVILCTGFSEGLSGEAARDFGIDVIIMKPLIAGELAKAVDRALGSMKTGD